MPQTDRQLRDRCLKGEPEAFGVLYDRHCARVYGLLVRLSGNVTQAEDLAQETFVTAYRSLASWRGEAPLQTWLCGIAVRIYRKACQGRVHLELDAMDETALPPSATDRDPLDHLTASDLQSALESAISELPDCYREVFVLLRIEVMAQRAVAELLDLPIGTVQSRLGRAVQILRRRLSEQGVVSVPAGTARGAKQDAV